MKNIKWLIFFLPLSALFFHLSPADARPPLGEAIRKNLSRIPPSPAKQEFSISRMAFAEAHWHGLELTPLTDQDRRQFLIPFNIKGVLVDEVTLEAIECGFLAADVLKKVEGYPTPDLKEFLIATMRIEKRREAKMEIYRQGKDLTLTLKAASYYGDLGYANMEGGEGGIPGQTLTPFDTEMFISVPPTKLSLYELNMLKQIDAQTTASPRSKNVQGKQVVEKLTFGEAIRRQKFSPSFSQGGGVDPMLFAKGWRDPVAFAEGGIQSKPAVGAPAVQAPAEFVQQPVEKQHVQQYSISTSTPAVSSAVKEPVAWMGLEVISVNEAIARQYKMTEAHGVLVNKVNKSSPASAVGIKRGDIITDVGKVKVTDTTHLLEIVSSGLAGDEVELSILRRDKQYSVSLFLGVRPSPASMLKLKMILVVGVFFIVYFLIFQEIFGHLFAFLLGSGVILYLGDYYHFYSIGDALKAVNYSILIFIIGMNIISAVLREAGFFNYIAKNITLFTKGDRWKILLLFSLLTYIISCFMDNIATILMMVPMTLALAKDLDFDPKPILICQIISSNIGGASTMMGDFPNMLISLSTELQFHDFIFYEMPACIICLIALLIYFKVSQKEFFEKKPRVAQGAAFFLEIKKGLKTAITNKKAVIKGITVLFFVLIGMIFSGKIGVNPAIIAFTGGIILLIICGMNRWRILKIVGIKDILFFACLFVMVGAAEASGMLLLFARLILDISGGSILLITLLMMWLAAGMCAFMNAGPTAALFIPVVMHLGINPPHYIFWWGLSLGVLAGSSCFLTSASGGPLASTLVGKFWKKHKKSLDKESPLYNLKKALSFREYAKMGVPIMLIILIISSIYLTALYLI